MLNGGGSRDGYTNGGTRRRWLRFIGMLFVSTTVVYEAALAAPKTDVVVLRNGDRLTGEVKELTHGQLEFKTDTMYTVMIKWEEVKSLRTDQYLEVELSNGLKYFGNAPDGFGSGVLMLAAGDDLEPWELQLAEVVRVVPIEQGDLLDRLKGNVSAGYSYTKASGVKQFTFSGGLRARAEKHQWSIDGSTTVTQQKNRPDSERFNVTGSFRRFLEDKRFWVTWATFESNDELGLQLRSLLGLGYGRYFLQTSLHELAWLVGIDATREDYAGEASRESSEAVLGLSYYLYRFSPLSADIMASAVAYPSLTESGRIRTEADLRTRYEIIKDLYFEIDVYYSADNRPGEEAIANYDYGVVTSLGYKF